MATESQKEFEDYRQTYTDIKELYTQSDQWIGKITTVCGWIKLFRVSGGKGKSIGFVRLSDGSNLETLQIIYDTKLLSEDNKEYFNDLIKRGKTGMSIMTTGLIVKSPKPKQPIEMQAHTYQILGDVMDADTYPVSKNEHTLEYLRTVPHLRLRTDTCSSIVRISSQVNFAMAKYFNKHGFIKIKIPLVTDNQCESGANPFRITTLIGNDNVDSIPTKDGMIDYEKDFFKKPVFLTVSGQLHLEAFASGLSKVFCETIAFRAEPSTGPLYLSEFLMVELEAAFITLEENMTINEGCIKYCIVQVLKNCYEDLEFLQQKFTPNLIETLKKYATKPIMACVKVLRLYGTHKVIIIPWLYITHRIYYI